MEKDNEMYGVLSSDDAFFLNQVVRAVEDVWKGVKAVKLDTEYVERTMELGSAIPEFNLSQAISLTMSLGALSRAEINARRVLTQSHLEQDIYGVLERARDYGMQKGGRFSKGDRI